MAKRKGTKGQTNNSSKLSHVNMAFMSIGQCLLWSYVHVYFIWCSNGMQK